MILGALVIVVVGTLIFNYFRGVSQEEAPSTIVEEEGIELVEEEGKLVPAGLPQVHKVGQGEHLWGIAEKYYGSGYNWVDIARENKLVNANQLLVAQELTIPRAEVRTPPAVLGATSETISGTTYTVEKGDHLWGIALRAYGDGYRWTEIAKENKLDNPNIIHPGNVLALPR